METADQELFFFFLFLFPGVGFLSPGVGFWSCKWGRLLARSSVKNVRLQKKVVTPPCLYISEAQLFFTPPQR